MNYYDFRHKVDDDLKRYNLRYGQTIMNCLAEAWPDKHREILGTDRDCFYNDNKAGTLLNYLEKIWNYETTR